ncbi:MAG: hypothetical protein SFX18_12795 [Pirellulales bacterium]|nr:hypothetical protein [Pirellulales bacterium]
MIYLKTALANMLLLIVLFGCCANSNDPPNPAPAPSTSEEHHHGSGPTGGVVFELGSHHAELSVDHEKKECTLLILGSDEKSPLTIAAKELTLCTKETKTADSAVVAPMTITLYPVDECEGKAAKFVGTDPGIGYKAEFAGTVIGEIDGKPVLGEFQE